MNLHDWIDELSDALEIEAEVDEGLILDMARVAAHTVERKAAPLSTFLLGYAAATHGAGPEEVEALAAKAQQLADNWDRPAGAPDPDEANAGLADEVPDDSAIDHTDDRYDA